MDKKKRKRMDTGPTVPGRKKILPVGPPRKKLEARGFPKGPRQGEGDDRGPRRDFGPRNDDRNQGQQERRTYRKREDGPPQGGQEHQGPKPQYRDFDGPKPRFEDKPRGKRPYTPRPENQDGPRRFQPKGYEERPPRGKFRREEQGGNGPRREFDGPRPQYREQDGPPRYKKEYVKSRPKKNAYPNMPAAPLAEPMRLNRYISQAGLCSRRDADVLIGDGKVKVNGEVITSLGTKVDPTKDLVTVEGREISIRHQVYLLMNKPKNFITTMEDEKGRRTVMEIVERYTRERLFPVGRLDRNTTGLLLFTNDGELAGKLTHPSHDVRKMYHVRLDRPMTEEDMAKLQNGFELEDGFIKPDRASYVDGKGMDEVGLELHSGRNRIVRRMMEHLRYEVVGLDRVAFGPLTKKELPRGTCRFLTPTEVGYLKMM
jgi:23S rRNA pseudouridine2605 synthase